MANVSLFGSAGGTITVPFTSVSNAVVAQTALAGINDAIAAGSLTEVVQTGGDLPAATQPSIVVLQPATALPPVEIGNGYVAAVLDGPQQQALISGVLPNETIISGTAGAIVGNLAANTDVFFGGGNNALLELGGVGFAPSATVWLDGSAYMDLSVGKTTVFASTGTAVDLVNNGTGANIVDFEESNPAAADNTVVISGTSETAATVNAVGGGLVAVQNGGAAVINANGSNVTIYGAPGPNWNGGGRVTLYGGMGSDSVSGGTGYFEAGTGGNSDLASGTVASAATLVGGASGDTLMAQGSGDLMVAGAGNETLTGADAPVIAVGYSGPQRDHVFTNMAGGKNGGNVFYIGNGTTYTNATHGSDGGNVFARNTEGPNNAVITGFVSAQDPSGAPQANPDEISLWKPGGGTYTLEQGSDPIPGQVTFNYTTVSGVASSEIEFGDGATWTLIGAMVQLRDFV